MADFSIDEINAVQAGTATSDTLKNIANTARNAACGFFKAYPSVVIPNPAFDFLDSMWDGLCGQSAPGLPPAPVPPFPGGQCVGDSYRFDYQFDVFHSSDHSLALHANGSHSFSGGPIYSIVFNSGQLVDEGIGVFLTYLNSSTATEATFQEDYGGVPNNYGANFTYTLTNLTHPADDCGSLPPKYPTPITPPTPTVPGGSIYNLSPVNITLNNGLTFNVTPQLNLSASLNPVIQIGGVNVSVGGGGVTIGTGGGSSVDPTALLNKILGNLGDGTMSGGGVGAVAAAAAKNTAPTPPPGGAGTQPPVPQPPTIPTVKNKPQVSSVQIFLTTLPNLRQTMFATDSTYNNYAAGWFEWLQGDLVVGNRLVIQSQETTYFAPKGADGYTFTLTNGAAGYSQVSELSS